MLVRKAEVLVFIQKAASLTPADEALLDLLHPLAEASLQNWMQQNLSYQFFVEYLPVGLPRMSRQPLLAENFGGPSLVDFRANSVAFMSGQPGTEFLQLKNTPVALTGLQVKEDIGSYAGQADGAFGDDTLLTVGEDYFLDVDDPVAGLSHSGVLYRVGTWPTEARSVKVGYYGGWTAEQLAGNAGGIVKLAALQCVSAAFWKAKALAKSQGIGPVTSESIGKYSYSISSALAAGNMTFSVPADVVQSLFSLRQLGRVFG